MSTSVGTEWWFYHLRRTTLERAVGPLLEKCLARDWRVLAVSTDPGRRSRLDEALWTYGDNSFLPHGQADSVGLEPADQPVLIAQGPDNLNGASVVLLMDGVAMPAETEFARCMVLFDDGDEHARSVARAQFSAAREAGLVAKYFQQTDQGWTQAA